MDNQYQQNGAPVQPDYGQPQPGYGQPMYAQPQVQYVNNDEVFHTGIGGWIGWLLLSSILPLLGLIIALCAAKDKSVKNWAAAQIVVGIIVVLVVVLATTAFGISLSNL